MTSSVIDPPATFGILYRGIVLQDTRREGTRAADPNGTITLGDVAGISGKLVCRWPYKTADGVTLYGYRPWEPGEDVTRTTCPAPKDWLRTIAEELRQRSVDYTLLGLPNDELAITRFVRDQPAVSAKLGLKAPVEPARLFSAGRAWFPRDTYRGAVDVESWRRRVDAHRSGDFGLLGRYQPVELTEEFLWGLGDQRVSVQNSAAIIAGAGAIRSQFPFPADLQKNFTRPAWFPDRRFVADLLTWLSPRETVTLCRVTHIND